VIFLWYYNRGWDTNWLKSIMDIFKIEVVNQFNMRNSSDPSGSESNSIWFDLIFEKIKLIWFEPNLTRFDFFLKVKLIWSESNPTCPNPKSNDLQFNWNQSKIWKKLIYKLTRLVLTLTRLNFFYKIKLTRTDPPEPELDPTRPNTNPKPTRPIVASIPKAL
jgi:hypothetical protein